MIIMTIDNGAFFSLQDKNTALHYASEEGYREIVLALIKYGANIEAKNEVKNCIIIMVIISLPLLLSSLS